MILQDNRTIATERPAQCLRHSGKHQPVDVNDIRLTPARGLEHPRKRGPWCGRTRGAILDELIGHTIALDCRVA